VAIYLIHLLNLSKYPSALMMLDDISLLSFEFSDAPGDEGPLLDTKLGGPLQPTPAKSGSNTEDTTHDYSLLLGDCNFKG
jgi:hypothetical protein